MNLSGGNDVIFDTPSAISTQHFPFSEKGTFQPRV